MADELKKEPTFDDIIEQKMFDYLTENLSMEVEQDNYLCEVRIRLKLFNSKTKTYDVLASDYFSCAPQN